MLLFLLDILALTALWVTIDPLSTVRFWIAVFLVFVIGILRFEEGCRFN